MVQHEDTIFAPLFWGFVLSIFLGGMTVVQAHVYFPGKGDRPIIRWTAALMLFFDLSSSVLIAYSVYYYLIPEFGSFERFAAVTPQFSAECLIAALITFMSQMYFVHQLVVVKRAGKGSWIVIGLITFFAVLAAIGGVGCVASMYVWDNEVLASRNRAFTIFFALAKGFNALTDILATTAMCLFLTDQKGGIAKTNQMLSQVMGFIIKRGILVTLIQVAVFVAFFAAPKNLAWLALHMNVTRLYANTFFAMLNGRTQLRDKHAGGTVVSSLHSMGHSRGIRTIDRHTEDIDLAHFRQQLSFPGSVSDNSAWLTEKSRIENGQGHLDRGSGAQFPIVTKTVVVSDI